MFDLPAAIDVLTTGKYNRLPTSISVSQWMERKFIKVFSRQWLIL